ncbi:type II DNA modification enzyme [Staphylococcus xylosus]|nr:type II DNA modification enzyme [Staphylococcus xylosus]
MSGQYQIEQLWKQHKYEVLWHDQNKYKMIREQLKYDPTIEEIETLIKEALSTTPSTGSIINAYDHMWGYFKRKCSSSEKSLHNYLKEAFKKEEVDEIYLLQFLKSMANYYDVNYVKNSTIIQKLN